MFDLIFAAGLCVAIDGDTLRCGQDRVRLWGIDSPEKGERGYAEAKSALQFLIQGQSIFCFRKGKSYNRIVAQCYSGPSHLDLQCTLLQSKFAIEWLRYSHNYYAKCSEGRNKP